MKTYAEQKDRTTRDWNKTLSELINGTSTESFYDIWTDSKSWVSCACGNQCSIIPRNEFGRPEDEYLAYLGDQFFELIDSRVFEEALGILGEIELRSAKLINEINSKNNNEKA